MRASTALHPLLRAALIGAGGTVWVLGLLLAGAAMAAGPIGPTSLAPVQAATVDLGPLAAELLAIAGGILGTLLLAVLAMIQKKLGIAADAEANRHLHEGLQRSVDAALVWADRQLAGRTKVEIESEMLAFAVDRTQRLLSGLLKYFGITTATLQDLLREKVERALDQRLAFATIEAVGPAITVPDAPLPAAR